MGSEKPLHEDYELSCAVLAELMSREDTEGWKHLLLEDFVTKCQELRPEARLYYAAKVLGTYTPVDVKQSVERVLYQVSPRPAVDVAIVTVIDPELVAAQVALDIPENTQATRTVYERRYWEGRITSAVTGEELKYVLTMVGEPRNVPCSLACVSMFNIYDVKLCILVGIAAGLEGKVSLGDTVGAKLVLDYEHQRLEVEGAKKRPFPYPLAPSIEKHFQHFNPARLHWEKAFQQKLEVLRNMGEEIPHLEENWTPEYCRGVILAGEKLFADGRTLQTLRDELHDEVRAGEEEGSGFARACREYAVPWLAFRGISDYGDPEKPKLWQPVAALSASTLALTFVKHVYRRLGPRPADT